MPPTPHGERRTRGRVHVSRLEQSNGESPILDMTDPLKLADENTPEWLPARLDGFGASEGGAVCGSGEFTTAYEVIARKCAGRLHREGVMFYDIAGTLGVEKQFAEWLLEPIEVTPAMRWGTQSEPLNLVTYEAKTGEKIIDAPVGLHEHPDHPFMLASPDARTATHLVECKAPNEFRLRDIGDTAPDDWTFQTNQQLFVMGLKVCHISMLAVQDVVVIPVERNDRLCGLMTRMEKEQWERVLANDLPPIDVEHTKSHDLVKQMFREVDEQRIMLSPEAVAAWEERQKLGRVNRENEKRMESLKTLVKAEIGSNYAGVLPGGKKMIRRKRIVSYVEAHTKDYVELREVNCDGVPISGGLQAASAAGTPSFQPELERV